MKPQRRRLGEILVDAGLISADQLSKALTEQRRRGGLLGKTLVDMGRVGENELVKILALHLNVAAVRLTGRVFSADALTVLDEAFCRKYQCVPLQFYVRERYFEVALVEPNNPEIIELIRQRAQCNVHPYIAGPTAVSEALERIYAPHRQPRPEPAARTLPDASPAQTAAGQGNVAPESPVTVLLGLQTTDSLEFDIDLSEESRLTADHVAVHVPKRAGDPPAEQVLSDIAALREELGELRGRLTANDQLLRTLIEQLNTRGIVDIAVRTKRDTIELEHVPPRDGQAATVAKESAVAPERGAPPPPPPEAMMRAPAHRGLSQQPLVVMDFGTSYSSVAVVVNRQAVPLKLPGGKWDMPSVVGCRRDGSVMLGSAARAMLATDPRRAIASPKRLLGRRYADPAIQSLLTELAMRSSEGAAGEVVLETPEGKLRVAEACAHILFLLRLVAERELDRRVQRLLLPIPVAFDTDQVAALKEAAAIAGLAQVHFIEEPVAAAYANVSDDAFRGRVGVYDFGGGTFDFSVVDVQADQSLKVLATAGEPWLGGDDLDEALANAAANMFWREHDIELRHQALQWQRLLVAAEEAKRELSDNPETVVELREVALTGEGALDLAVAITRSEFAALAAEVIARSFDTVDEALSRCGLRASDLNAVYLSGGTCYVPAVRETVTRYFGRPPTTSVRPERAVLLGAAIYGSRTVLA